MEKIDMGNGEIREISSGLRKHYTLDQMTNAMVVVICNLKPRKVAGNLSAGMVLCASTKDKSTVEFLTPPEGSVPGDLISFEGYERKPLDVLPDKKNN
jgi:tRNA-binding EMAP/Myf-like protein